MNPTKFFAELKRRNVYSVAVTYVVVGWILIQVVTQVFPPFDIPMWMERLVIIAIVLGFPVALILGWVYDFTRQGIKRTAAAAEETRAHNVEIVRPPLLPAATDSTEKSIAVLPFHDLSPGKDHDYFSDGIAEEILAEIGRAHV